MFIVKQTALDDIFDDLKIDLCHLYYGHIGAIMSDDTIADLDFLLYTSKQRIELLYKPKDGK